MNKKLREKQEQRSDLSENSPLNKFSPEKIYLYILEGGICLALLTPLILMKQFFFPYVAPKTIYFRIIVDLLLIVYILLVLSNRRYLPRFNAVTIAVTIFIAVTALTSFTGVNLFKSFWSTFERMTGLLTLFHLYVFFIILSSVFRERKQWERFFTVSIIYGVGLTFYILTSDDPTARGGGTLGNTDFMAVYMLFNIFFAITLFFFKRGLWKLFYAGLLAPLLWILFFTPREPSLGAQGAFVGGLGLLAINYLLFYLFSSGRRKWAILLLLMIALAILGAGLGFQIPSARAKIIALLPASSLEARLVVWDMGFLAFQERPWLGWGVDNFNIPFTEYFDPSLPLTHDVWYDRVHSIILDVLVASGIFGLLSYLAIFGVSVFLLLRLLSAISEQRNIFLPLGMVSLLAAYFFANIWVFDMISTYMMFFFTLAFVSFLVADKKPTVTPLPSWFLSSRYLAGAFLIIGAILTIYFANLKSLQASYYLVQAMVAPAEKTVFLFQKAFASSPMAMIEGAEQFSRRVTDLIYAQQTVDRLIIKTAFELSVKEMKRVIAQSPDDFRAYLVLGREYNDYFSVTQDPEFLKEAQNYLEKAVALSPRNQQAYWALAQTKLSQGKSDEALSLMQKAADLEPGFGLAQWYLAITYGILGQDTVALATVEKAEKAGFNWRESLEYITKVISLLQNVQDDETLVPIYLLAIEKDPNDARFRAGLAVAYANLGQYNKARQSAAEAIALNPKLAPEFEQFLQSLPK